MQQKYFLFVFASIWRVLGSSHIRLLFTTREQQQQKSLVTQLTLLLHMTTLFSLVVQLVQLLSAEKTKLMTNNTCGINTEIKVNGQKLETVTSIQYLE